MSIAAWAPCARWGEPGPDHGHRFQLWCCSRRLQRFLRKEGLDEAAPSTHRVASVALGMQLGSGSGRSGHILVGAQQGMILPGAPVCPAVLCKLDAAGEALPVASPAATVMVLCVQWCQGLRRELGGYAGQGGHPQQWPLGEDRPLAQGTLAGGAGRRWVLTGLGEEQ